MKQKVFTAFFILFLVACSDKTKEPPKNYISALSLIKNQVAHVDSSLYSIMKTITYDSAHTDTSYIPREEFEIAAAEFLDIPDLSNQKVARRFKEEEARYDDVMNRVIITYVPVDPEEEEIKKQEIMVSPNIATGDQIKNIIINKVISNRDSFMEKKLLWQMDKSFQVVIIKQKPGMPSTIATTKVSWNEE